MGKRRSFVVLSSSSSSSEKEDARRTPASRRRSSAASSGSSSSKKRPRRRTSAMKDDFRKSEFDMLSEEFSECFHPLSHAKELWVDKYKPQSLSDLAVHKKKIEEVKNWLEERLKTPKQGFGDYTLLVTGQAGVGKSTVIHVLAKELKFELCEWRTPTPTLWSEHLHHTNPGLKYMSKLEEFEIFTENTRKYSSLPLNNTTESNKPFVILIDDIPVTNGKTGLKRLSKSLTDLTRLTRFPTVILLTQCHKTESTDNSSWYWEELDSVLVKSGAQKISFNPITVISMKKTLYKITKDEKFSEISSESIEQIAKSSGGDIRNAITSLQYFCLNPQRNSLISDEYREPHSLTSCFGRDETLSLFHALGKFLHNKREPNNNNDSNDCIEFELKDKFKRNPMKMEEPEMIISRAHGQARPITDFLHENVLDFIDFDAVLDASVVSSYLSDSDCLLTNKRNEFEGLASIIAASVSVRGVLFGNSQPAPSKWHAIRSPKIRQVERSMRENRDEMLRERFGRLEISNYYLNLSDLATDFRPVMRLIGSDYLTSGDKSNSFYENSLVSEEECNEDEIEDW